jgi:hypothetical protein
MAGCAQKNPTIARIEGTEPQRISFGDPKTVQAAFTDKMKGCWFGAQGGLPPGYKYDIKSALLDSGDSQDTVEQVMVYGNGAVFVIQFNPFNENTLISTRSQGFPPQLAVRIKQDVETWIFEREGCTTDEDLSIKGTAAAAPPQPQSSGWW